MTKICSKCGIEKPLDEFYKDKSKKDGRQPWCGKCDNKRTKNYHQKHRKKIAKQKKRYRQEHREEIAAQRKYLYENGGREKAGKKSIYEDKTLPQYLGIVIGERLCRHLFKDVEMMPYGNPKFDFICNKGKKIDVKSGCIIKGKYPSWKFNIRRNKIADFFILVAFDNRTDLNPLHLWMIPGNELNKQTKASVSPSTIHKWDKWKMDITDARLCCAELKSNEQMKFGR